MSDVILTYKTLESESQEDEKEKEKLKEESENENENENADEKENVNENDETLMLNFIVSIVKLENDTSPYRRLDSSWLEPLCEHLADILQNISHSELWNRRRSHAACAVACRKCDSSKFFEICSHTLWY